MKKTIKLKIVLRTTGIVVLAAIIGLSFPSCSDGSEPTYDVKGFEVATLGSALLGLIGNDTVENHVKFIKRDNLAEQLALEQVLNQLLGTPGWSNDKLTLSQLQTFLSKQNFLNSNEATAIIDEVKSQRFFAAYKLTFAGTGFVTIKRR